MIDSPDWAPPPAELRLGAADLHIWLIQVDPPPESLRALAATLSPDEQHRAARFHFERDRIRFVAARGNLRRILSRYRGCNASDITFEYSSHGKPALPHDPLSFNLSHSGDWALCAVTLARRVGVDIELLRPDLASETIAERFFAPGEVAALRALPLGEQTAAFFRCWTRKEAFVKARGEGLSLPLDRFEVTLGPAEPARIQSTFDDPLEANRWSVASLPVPPLYEAAVVVEAAPGACRVRHYHALP
jgi:4'-phosphopantetheinyl transferase